VQVESESTPGRWIPIIDRKGHGDWATCPDIISVRDLLMGPSGGVTSPLVVAVDIGFTGVLKASRVLSDGGNAKFAANVQRRVNELRHSTPSTMTEASPPITYSYHISFLPLQ
jgi:hypothetical protein